MKQRNTRYSTKPIKYDTQNFMRKQAKQDKKRKELASYEKAILPRKSKLQKVTQHDNSSSTSLDEDGNLPTEQQVSLITRIGYTKVHDEISNFLSKYMDLSSDEIQHHIENKYNVQGTFSDYMLRYQEWFNIRQKQLDDEQKERDILKKAKELTTNGTINVDSIKPKKLTGSITDFITVIPKSKQATIKHEFELLFAYKVVLNLDDTSYLPNKKTKQVLTEQFYKMKRSKLGIRNYNELSTKQKEDMLDAVSNMETCPNCQSKKIIKQTCKNCGVIQGFEGPEMQMSFKDMENVTIVKRRTQPYNPKTHFKDTLDRMQGVEKKDIPYPVQVAILKKLKSEGIEPLQQPKKITYKRIRRILQSLKYSKYFGHITKIIKIVTNNQNGPEPLTYEESVLITSLFEQTVRPFEIIKEKHKRKSLPKYQYMIFKLCQMININRFEPYLHKFEARSKEVDAEKVWKEVCDINKDLNYWKYIPLSL